MARSSFAVRPRSSATLRVCVAAAVTILGALSTRAAFVLIRPIEAVRDHQRLPSSEPSPSDVQKAVESVEKAVEAARLLQSHKAEYERNLPGPGVTQGPPWSTCSVEYQEGGRNVLEEWVMRGERQTVASFRHFRRSALAGVTAVRCEETAPMASLDAVTCLECVLDDSGSAIMKFGTLEQCIALSVGGHGFCKSGSVAVMHR